MIYLSLFIVLSLLYWIYKKPSKQKFEYDIDYYNGSIYDMRVKENSVEVTEKK